MINSIPIEIISKYFFNTIKLDKSPINYNFDLNEGNYFKLYSLFGHFNNKISITQPIHTKSYYREIIINRIINHKNSYYIHNSR